MELKRVVVTGLGAITPVGNTLEATWNSLINGVSGAAPIQSFDASRFKTHFACEVKDFKAADFIDRKEIRKMDLYEQYAVVAAMQAVQDSGLDLETVDKDNIGVVLGVGIGGIHTFEEQISEYALTQEEKGPRFSPFFIPKMIADIASGQISIMYGFHGPNYTTTSACASSTNAIADAFNLIRLGKANAIITGGAEAAISPGGLGGFNAMHALSTRNDDPQRASRPFSKSRDGFVMGEGAGILVLEELEHAKARGAKIYCELAGAGMSADAHHLTASHPEGLGEDARGPAGQGGHEPVGGDDAGGPGGREAEGDDEVLGQEGQFEAVAGHEDGDGDESRDEDPGRCEALHQSLRCGRAAAAPATPQECRGGSRRATGARARH